MDIKKSIDTLSATIKNGYKANANDVDAFNDIIEHINNERKHLHNNYHLFGKLFVGVFIRDMIKYNGDSKRVLDELTTMLRIDLASHYDQFYREINSIEFDLFCEFIGMSGKHPAIKTKKETENDSQLIEENAETLSKLMNKYSKNKVINRLNGLIIDLIERYDVV